MTLRSVPTEQQYEAHEEFVQSEISRIEAAAQLELRRRVGDYLDRLFWENVTSNPDYAQGLLRASEIIRDPKS